jgi:hypothetical protein
VSSRTTAAACLLCFGIKARRGDPLSGRKKWVSRQIPGAGRAALKEAKQLEA